MPVLALEDVLSSKLLSLNDHHLDYEPALAIARAVREQIDWEQVRRRTSHSPYARGFFALLDELGLQTETSAAPAPGAAKIRVVPS
jgi:hypothetical protein